MILKHSILALAGFTLVATMAGCDRAATKVTSTPAEWSYVKEAWGGVVVKEPVISGESIELIFDLQVERATRIDSAICTCGVESEWNDNQIMISINQCICGPGAGEILATTIKRPPSGTYKIAYSDVSAGNPVIGELSVP